MPKSRKVSKKRSPTRKFVVKKGLRGGPLIEEAKQYLEFKGITAMELKARLGVKADGSLTRGSKTMGPFIFTCERSNIGGGKLSDVSFLHVYYKDGAKKDGMIIA